MSEDLTSRLLGEQRKRMIASMLGAAEQSAWWRKLTTAEQRAFRDKMLSAVGVFYDFCRDIVKITGEDSIRNDYAVELLQQIHTTTTALHREAGRRPEMETVSGT